MKGRDTCPYKTLKTTKYINSTPIVQTLVTMFQFVNETNLGYCDKYCMQLLAASWLKRWQNTIPCKNKTLTPFIYT